MSDTKPWRKLWRDVNTDAKFKALARDTQLVFLRLLPELTDDGRFEPEINADVALKITMLMSLPKRVVSKAIAELTRYGMATIEANGTLFVPAFSTRQQSASSKPSTTKPTSSNAERQRAYRARRNAQRNASGGVTVTESNGVTHVTRNGNVTESNVTGDVTAVTRSDSESVSSSSSASGKIEDFRPQSSETEGAPARETKPKRNRREAKPDTTPMPGTIARRVYDAIVADPVLRPITVNPGDFAERATNPDAHKCDVLAEVLKAGEWASRQPPSAAPRDGRRFLANWLARGDADAAARPQPIARHPNINRGSLPAATADEWKNSTDPETEEGLMKLLGQPRRGPITERKAS